VADVKKYPLPEEITLQLTFHDVYLNFFKDKKERILRICSGAPLFYNDGYLHNRSGEKVAFLSKQALETLKKWENKGYAVQAAKVNYIVAWKGQGEENETAVLLPELVLAKFTDDTL
jgi:ATP-dependent DNA helicase RecQ